jgi:hypothetical protein
MATCCMWVFGKPRYRVRRNSNARTPCESVLRASPLFIALDAFLTAIPGPGGGEGLVLLSRGQPQPAHVLPELGT